MTSTFSKLNCVGSYPRSHEMIPGILPCRWYLLCNDPRIPPWLRILLCDDPLSMSVWSDAVVLQTRGIKNDWDKDVLTSPKDQSALSLRHHKIHIVIEHIVSSINPRETKNERNYICVAKYAFYYMYLMKLKLIIFKNIHSRLIQESSHMVSLGCVTCPITIVFWLSRHGPSTF